MNEKFSAQVMPHFNYTYKKGTPELKGLSPLMAVRPTFLDGAKTAGLRDYELTDHLSNVMAVISDRKLSVDTNYDNITDYYAPQVVSYTDYYPFGFPMTERSGNLSGYRFGFNGQESDGEIYGVKTTYAFEARLYNSILGRWFSPEPLRKECINISSYSYCKNNAIWLIDFDGKKIFIYNEDKSSYIEYEAGMTSDTYTGFIKQTIDALNVINNQGKGIGGDMIYDLTTTNEIIKIIYTTEQENAAEGLTAQLNPQFLSLGIDEQGNREAPAYFLTVTHELAHVWDFWNGTINIDEWYSYTKDNGEKRIITQAEKFATHIENIIRSMHNIPLRTHYGVIQENDIDYGDPESKLLNGRKSLFYNIKMQLMPPDGGMMNDVKNKKPVEIEMPYEY